MPKTPVKPYHAVLQDIRRMVKEARKKVASTVNTELTVLYWRIGHRTHVAEFLTVLPPKEQLRKKFHQAIEQSRLRMGTASDGE